MNIKHWRVPFIGLALAACATASPASRSLPQVIIQDVTVVDVVGGRLVPHTDVVIAGEKIASLAPHRAGRAVAGTTLRDGRGKFLIQIWLTGLLFRSQGPVLAGTDTGVEFSSPGFSLHDELAMLVRAGLSPLDALRAGAARR